MNPQIIITMVRVMIERRRGIRNIVSSVRYNSRMSPTTARMRLQSIDILRGAIMILMALDHVRDFFNTDAQQFAPDNLAKTTAALFFTRWVTHFCAPTFMLLAGVGAALWEQRGRSRGELSRFLLIRGLWLIVVEFTLVRFAFFFNVDYSVVILLVFWAIGASMIVLAGLIHLPRNVLLAISVLMIAGHNLLDGVKAGPVWTVLHEQGAFRLFGSTIVVAYPLVPWIGVMTLGYCAGPLFRLDSERRRTILIRTGIAVTAAFLVVRAINVYGDPRPWTGARPVLSFLNCTKYPPSLDFLLMTLGPAILVLGLLEHVRLSNPNPLLVFGRVPFFYFVLHLFVLHAVAVIAAGFQYGEPLFLLRHKLPTLFGRSPDFPADYGYGLIATYGWWLLVVILLYPACRWFANLKARRRDPWLSYL
jgi:uncharacterized membrane protein